MAARISEELLNDTYKHIAEQYEMKGNLKKAEHYYVEAQGWVLLAAFDMNGTIPVDSVDATSNTHSTSVFEERCQSLRGEDVDQRHVHVPPAREVGRCEAGGKGPPIFFHESKS